MSTLDNLKVLTPLLISKALKKDSSQRKRVNQFLLKQMGEQKGLWLKVGQMLSLQPESWEELGNLADSNSLPALDEEDFLPYLNALFTNEGYNLFEEFPKITFPGLPASLSQVHYARDKNNQNWVIKAKLPGIESVISDQLSLLGLIQKFEPLRKDKKNFSTQNYQTTLIENFSRELDYQKERSNLTQIKALEKRFPDIHIPNIHPYLQGKDFIVMEEFSGLSWQEVQEFCTPKEKIEIARKLFQHFLFQYFCLGLAQGDFHPGNFIFLRKANSIHIQWIDLGQCLNPTSAQRVAIFNCIEGIVHKENLKLGPLFNAWNFDLEKLSPIANRLPLLLTKIFAPFVNAHAFNLKEWKLKEEIEQILGEDKWWFRTAGSPELFLSIRCWIGLFSMIESLDVSLPYQSLWKEMVHEIRTTMPSIELPQILLESVTFKDLAKSLRVQIFHDGREHVSVTLPARAIEDIETFLSPNTILEMEKAGIDLNKIVLEQLRKGMIPGIVIDYSDRTSRYLVTLE